MKAKLELPVVEACAVTQCAYNTEELCHARAITVGHGVHPQCDTFLPSAEHTHDNAQVAGVGACKVTACRHNQDFECTAEGIRVGYHREHADCMTFSPR